MRWTGTNVQMRALYTPCAIGQSVKSLFMSLVSEADFSYGLNIEFSTLARMGIA